MSWDKSESVFLRSLGLNDEQIGAVIGSIAEHRQDADRLAFNRGYMAGLRDAKQAVSAEESGRWARSRPDTASDREEDIAKLTESMRIRQEAQEAIEEADRKRIDERERLIEERRRAKRGEFI